MGLSDIKVRNTKPREKPYKISDGEGLYLLVSPKGKKYWRFKYRFGGKEKVLAFGMYPDVLLADARDYRAQARRQLKAGNDPSVIKNQVKRQLVLEGQNSFEVVAREWLKKKSGTWSKVTLAIHLARMEQNVFPRLGHRPIAHIEAPEVLDMLRVVEKRGALETAARIKQDCGYIFMYAIATARAVRNPVPDLKGALETPVTKHHPYLKAEELPEFFKMLEQYDCLLLTKLAIRLLSLTFVRTTELRAALWTEINFDKAEWRIPAERMKMKTPHIVPLSRQAIEILRQIQKISGNRAFIFPSQKNFDDCMSNNTMLTAIYRMKYKSRTTPHGFRSTASTILNEHGFAPDVIERQLAHCERNSVRAAYNHAQYLPERRKMMQWYADYLDEAVKKKSK